MSQIIPVIPGTGAAPIETITGDVGGPVGPDAAGNINLLTGGGLTTTGNPGTNTITITLDGDIATQYTTDAGVAVPAANNLNILGGNNIMTSAVASTIVIDVVGTTNHALQVGDATGSLNSLAPAGNGEIPIGSVGADPVIATLTAGAGIAIVNGPGSITISAAGAGGITWNEIVVVGPTAMAVNNGYIANNPAAVGLTLPAVAAVGDIVRVTGKGAGGWNIQQNAGQTIFFGNQTTTTGALGGLFSTLQRDTVELVCVTANNDWNVISVIGNIIVV